MPLTSDQESAGDLDPLCTQPSALLTAARPADERPSAPFDLQGHRGARGIRPENTLPAFALALELGVTTLELDVGVTADGAVVVTHDRSVSPLKSRDTKPAFPGDPAFPYVGKPIHALTLAQLETLDMTRRRPAEFANDPFVGTQRPVPGTRIATLREVFELAERYGADEVRFNIETKVDPRHPEETLPPEPFAARLLEVVEAYGMTARTTIQSFDWRTLRFAQRELPALRRVALVERRTTRPPWLAGRELDDFAGDVVAAAAVTTGASAFSPDHEFLDRAMLASAHWRGLAVVPWTVNDPADMRRLIDLGVDGLITDYPQRLRHVMAARGMALPRMYAPVEAPATEHPAA